MEESPMRALTNAWYMAGWSTEVPAEVLVERTIIGRSLVLFRDSAGRVCALNNRCPHRFAPLHLGKYLGNGVIRCGYHGLEFNGLGQCVGNPHSGGRALGAAEVQTFATQERNGIIWIWLGNRESSNPDLIPDFSTIDPERCYTATQFLTVNANYTLASDNILDLSHIQFLHPDSLGSSAVANADVEVLEVGNTVFSKRFVEGEVLPSFVEATFAIPHGAKADRWLDVRWDAPASLLLTVTVALSGAPREQGRTVVAAHIFTPVTDSVSQYRFLSAFSRADYPDGAEQAKRHAAGLVKPFATEDLPMLEAQQRVIGSSDFWSLKPVLLRGDTAAVKARRALDKLIKAEHTATAQAASREPQSSV
jgi:phenylpropionate dioxygenase-like ring-hydroxylating dioxygenase large terminal subunit